MECWKSGYDKISGKRSILKKMLCLHFMMMPVRHPFRMDFRPNYRPIGADVNILQSLHLAYSHSTICRFLHNHLVFPAEIFDLVELFFQDLCSEIDEGLKTCAYFFRIACRKICVLWHTWWVTPVWTNITWHAVTSGAGVHSPAAVFLN